MAVPLLASKLQVPSYRRDLVRRARLTSCVARAAESPLALLSAPAGFGKTTLLREWRETVASGGPAVAWVSLDQRDNDPAIYWAYVFAALKAAVAGADAVSLPESPQQPIEVGIATLLNDLSALERDVVLVLDDYHVIESPEVHDAMTFLLDHLPARLRVVIATRVDPPLPLARLRGRGELVEIRVDDLRFNPGEAAEYFNGSMGLGLAGRDVVTLHGRTEGWIAALQLAALSMSGRDDRSGFIAGFAGDDRYIVDYLTDEVLRRQPEGYRTFLLQTSILDRLCGSLCDAVTDHSGGRKMLEALDRANLFLVPLDDRRQWYRYHRLFADVLQAHLVEDQPDEVAELNRRASAWYDQNGLVADAIHHALAARDFDEAARLVEMAIPAVRKGRQDATLRGWLDALPSQVTRVRPVLSLGLVGVLMAAGELDRAEGPLADAERGLGPAADPAEYPQLVVADEEGYRRLPGTVAMYRAAQAYARDDVHAAVSHAKRAMALSTDDDHLNRAAAAGFLGLASWRSGDLADAHRAYVECTIGLRRAGHDADVMAVAIALADIRLAQGRLGDALRTYEQALRHPARQPGLLPGTADMHVGMIEVHLERNELVAARQQLLKADDSDDGGALPQHRYRWHVARARIMQAEGDAAGAIELLDQAERRYDGSDFFPYTRPIAALRTRVLTAQGRLSEALAWTREAALSPDDDLSYLREFEHITLARVLLAKYAEEQEQDSLADAAQLLERLLAAADHGGRVGRVIEILILQSGVYAAAGDRPGAIACVQRAVSLAEPEGHVRVFIDAGPRLGSMLTSAAKSDKARRFVRRLQAAPPKTEGRSDLAQELIEPLSKRELEVLRLLATHLDGPDIARELVVSLNTIRTHTKHIYAKLGVNSRRAAVRQGKQLNLL